MASGGFAYASASVTYHAADYGTNYDWALALHRARVTAFLRASPADLANAAAKIEKTFRKRGLSRVNVGADADDKMFFLHKLILTLCCISITKPAPAQ